MLFLIIEGALAVLDIPSGIKSRDPFVGFSSQADLFIASVSTVNGKKIPVMMTRPQKRDFFPKQSFAKTKPAGTLRAFCIGGSTTYGRPYTYRTSFCSWLEEFLNYTDKNHRWKTVNAGGVSYASYRIALLMEELIHYEPDLFVVYTGHNEFLERRTYSNILRLPEMLRDLLTLAAQTRIYGLVNDTIGYWGFGRRRRGEVHMIPEEVAPILDKTIGPEDYVRDDEQQQNVVGHFRYNLKRIVRLARSVHAKVVVVNPASKLRHEAPFKSQHRSGLGGAALAEWNEQYRTARRLVGRRNFHAALPHIQKADAMDPRYAHGFALEGDVLYELGRYDEAREAYQRAVDEDVCPLRAITPLQTSVKQVARRMKVPLVDFKSAIAKRSPHGITDEKMFLDHVHPTIEGHEVLALEILKRIITAGAIHSPRPMTRKAKQRVEHTILSHVDFEANAEALINRAMLANWGGKFREGRTLALRALEIYPDYVHTYYRSGLERLISEGQLAEPDDLDGPVGPLDDLLSAGSK